MVYKYREVRGTFTALTPDTTDADEHPDIVPLTGSVVLTPIYKDGGISFSESGHFDQPQPKPAAIDPDGILRSVVTDPVTGAISRQPLFLPVTVDERANQEWTYEASFPEVVRTDTGERVDIPTKRFAVEPGDGPLNLVAVATTRHPGMTITKGAPGAGLLDISAANGEITFSWDNGLTTTIGVPDAVPGPPGEDGVDGVDGAPGADGEDGLPGLKGDPGDVRFEGIDPGITVRTDDVLIGDTAVPSVEHVNNIKFINDTFVPFGANWNDLAPDRMHKVTESLSVAAAQAQNAPGPGRWVVWNLRNFSNLWAQVAFLNTIVPGAARLMYRGSSSAGWGPWESLTGASPELVEEINSRVGAIEATPEPPSSGFKTVGLPITAGHSGSDAPSSGTYRIPIDWLPASVPVSRVKVRLRNINIRNGSTRSGDVNLAGIWLGTPDAEGHFPAAPVQVAGAVTFDGAAGYESPWIDVPGGTLTDKAISYAYTATAAPWAQLASGWFDPDQVGYHTGKTGFSVASTAAFTVDLIVETYATTPVVATIGDSSSVGVGAKYLRESWGALLAQKLNAIPQILGSSGDTAQASTDAGAFKFNRFPGHTPADALLFALGTNDAATSKTLEQIGGYMEDAINGSRHLGRRIYGVSAKPRNNDTPGDGFEERRRTISSWLAEQRWGLHGYIDYVPAISDDDDSILPEFDADGTHVNLAGYQAIADRIASTYRVTAPAVQYVA